MEEDTDTANWVMVDEKDCLEEGSNEVPPVLNVPATTDSDQESDGSISIISGHNTDNYNSEEETEIYEKNDSNSVMSLEGKMDGESEDAPAEVAQEEIQSISIISSRITNTCSSEETEENCTTQMDGASENAPEEVAQEEIQSTSIISSHITNTCSSEEAEENCTTQMDGKSEDAPEEVAQEEIQSISIISSRITNTCSSEEAEENCTTQMDGKSEDAPAEVAQEEIQSISIISSQITNTCSLEETEEDCTTQMDGASENAPEEVAQEEIQNISIISSHITNTCSSEEAEENGAIQVLPIIKINEQLSDEAVVKEDMERPEPINLLSIHTINDLGGENILEENKIPNVEVLEKLEERDITQDDCSNHGILDDDSVVAEPANKNWTLADEESTKVELEASQNKFFLDCSHEPILEVSANDTDVEIESDISNQECQTIVHKEHSLTTHMNNKDGSKDRELYINRISIGFILSLIVLASSHLLQQCLDSGKDGLYSPDSSSKFLDSIADNEQLSPIINYCSSRLKEKGQDYSEKAIEKCITKKLKKKNKEADIKKTEIYLKMKERILELREKDLLKKEKKIMQKWKKKMYNKEKNNIILKNEFKEKRLESSDGFNNQNEKLDKVGSIQKEQKWRNSHSKFKNKASVSKPTWMFQKAKNPIKFDDEMRLKESSKFNKRDELENMKKKVKNFYKESKKESFDEEWYIKYNPVKNTIKLINITTLPQQDSILIKNGNKTINGQWYFSLYGYARPNVRNKEKAAEWFFRRAHFREIKRDKAKWYFDYMYERDNLRY